MSALLGSIAVAVIGLAPIVAIIWWYERKCEKSEKAFGWNHKHPFGE